MVRNRGTSASTDRERRPEVVVVGGGFGGLAAAKGLGRAAAGVTVVDRVNYHLFQPLLYQVAMAGLSPAEIAIPIRSVLARQPNTRVLLGEAVRVELERRAVQLADGAVLPYDYLVLAAGARTNFFGREGWAQTALGMKVLEDALEIRRRVLLAFEAAERTADRDRRRELLTFVIIGGGPTGVELAGALAELAHRVLMKDFRVVTPDVPRIVLLEGAERLLLGFAPRLGASALRTLHALGVEVRLGTRVTGIGPGYVEMGHERLVASSIIWTAGVRPVELAATLPVERDRAGRVVVAADCSLPAHPEVFVIGDMAACAGTDGKPLPGIAPVALQQGRHVARTIRRALAGEPRAPFRYFDKGIMATIGRSRAVLQAGRVRMSGFWAWLLWIFIHVMYLVGFRNRVLVLFNWSARPRPVRRTRRRGSRCRAGSGGSRPRRPPAPRPPTSRSGRRSARRPAGGAGSGTRRRR